MLVLSPVFEADLQPEQYAYRPGWIKAWLEMAVGEDDGSGGRRRTNRARRERRGTPQGAPISPLFSNIYMRRFIMGWKVLGYSPALQGRDYQLCR